MQQALALKQVDIKSSDFLPRINIAGPFLAPADQVFQYDCAVLVGAGIGITPYMAILRHFKHHFYNINSRQSTKKIYLIWICRDVKTFTCMQYFLKQLEQEGLDAIVDISLYWTVKSVKASECQQICQDTVETNIDDPLTGLKSATYYGRPRWDVILEDLQTNHGDEKVGLFICGPKALTMSVRNQCKEMHIKNPNMNKISIHDEVF